MDWSNFFRKMFKAGVYMTPAMLTLLADKIEERFGAPLKQIDHKIDCLMGNVDPPMDLPTLALAVSEQSDGRIKDEDAKEMLLHLGEVLAGLEPSYRHAQCKLLWNKEE